MKEWLTTATAISKDQSSAQLVMPCFKADLHCRWQSAKQHGVLVARLSMQSLPMLCPGAMGPWHNQVWEYMWRGLTYITSYMCTDLALYCFNLCRKLLHKSRIDSVHLAHTSRHLFCLAEVRLYATDRKTVIQKGWIRR